MSAMKTILGVASYVLWLATVASHHWSEPPLPVIITYNPSETLDLTIHFWNIPQCVTDVHIIQQSGSIQEKVSKLPKDNRDRSYRIVDVLTYPSILIEVKIVTTTGVGRTLTVANGTCSTSLPDWKPERYYSSDFCLVQNPCWARINLSDIILCPDINKVSEAKPQSHARSSRSTMKNIAQYSIINIVSKIFCGTDTPTSFTCYKANGNFICTLSGAVPSTQYNMYQTYDNKSFIGVIPQAPINQKETVLIIELEEFDINTSIVCAELSLNQRPAPTWSENLRVTMKDIQTRPGVILQYYSETAKVSFSCQKYKNVQIGLINTENRIETRNKTELNETLSLASNGTTLCCLYYEIINSEQTQIRRHVTDKTLLIYKYEHNNASDSTNGTDRQPETEEQSAPFYETSTFIYVCSSFLVICVILLTLYIYMKRFCFKRSQPTDAVELDTYCTSNQMLYAELDLASTDNQPTTQTEESPYAVIIGTLQPFK